MTLLTPILCIAFSAGGPPKDNPHESQAKIDPARIVQMETQELRVEDFQSDGWILDIGGGGEGVIGRLKGSQVVAIDLYAWGMNRTPPGPLKLVMDATDLKFLDGSFGTVTSFFTLMYMDPASQEKALREAFRVVKAGGRLRIWEVRLPAKTDPRKDVITYPFVFRLPKETIETGYGTLLHETAMDVDYYVRLAESVGFVLEDRSVEGKTLRLVARRP